MPSYAYARLTSLSNSKTDAFAKTFGDLLGNISALDFRLRTQGTSTTTPISDQQTFDKIADFQSETLEFRTSVSKRLAELQTEVRKPDANTPLLADEMRHQIRRYFELSTKLQALGTHALTKFRPQKPLGLSCDFCQFEIPISTMATLTGFGIEEGVQTEQTWKKRFGSFQALAMNGNFPQFNWEIAPESLKDIRVALAADPTKVTYPNVRMRIKPSLRSQIRLQALRNESSEKAVLSLARQLAATKLVNQWVFAEYLLSALEKNRHTDATEDFPSSEFPKLIQEFPELETATSKSNARSPNELLEAEALRRTQIAKELAKFMNLENEFENRLVEEITDLVVAEFKLDQTEFDDEDFLRNEVKNILLVHIRGAMTWAVEKSVSSWPIPFTILSDEAQGRDPAIIESLRQIRANTRYLSLMAIFAHFWKTKSGPSKLFELTNTALAEYMKNVTPNEIWGIWERAEKKVRDPFRNRKARKLNQYRALANGLLEKSRQLWTEEHAPDSMVKADLGLVYKILGEAKVPYVPVKDPAHVALWKNTLHNVQHPYDALGYAMGKTGDALGATWNKLVEMKDNVHRAVDPKNAPAKPAPKKPQSNPLPMRDVTPVAKVWVEGFLEKGTYELASKAYQDRMAETKIEEDSKKAKYTIKPQDFLDIEQLASRIGLKIKKAKGQAVMLSDISAMTEADKSTYRVFARILAQGNENIFMMPAGEGPSPEYLAKLRKNIEQIDPFLRRVLGVNTTPEIERYKDNEPLYRTLGKIAHEAKRNSPRSKTQKEKREEKTVEYSKQAREKAHKYIVRAIQLQKSKAREVLKKLETGLSSIPEFAAAWGDPHGIAQLIEKIRPDLKPEVRKFVSHYRTQHTDVLVRHENAKTFLSSMTLALGSLGLAAGLRMAGRGTLASNVTTATLIPGLVALPVVIGQNFSQHYGTLGFDGYRPGWAHQAVAKLAKESEDQFDTLWATGIPSSESDFIVLQTTLNAYVHEGKVLSDNFQARIGTAISAAFDGLFFLALPVGKYVATRLGPRILNQKLKWGMQALGKVKGRQVSLEDFRKIVSETPRNPSLRARMNTPVKIELMNRAIRRLSWQLEGFLKRNKKDLQVLGIDDLSKVELYQWDEGLAVVHREAIENGVSAAEADAALGRLMSGISRILPASRIQIFERQAARVGLDGENVDVSLLARELYSQRLGSPSAKLDAIRKRLFPQMVKVKKEDVIVFQPIGVPRKLRHLESIEGKNAVAVAREFIESIPTQVAAIYEDGAFLEIPRLDPGTSLDQLLKAIGSFARSLPNQRLAADVSEQTATVFRDRFNEAAVILLEQRIYQLASVFSVALDESTVSAVAETLSYRLYERIVNRGKIPAAQNIELTNFHNFTTAIAAGRQRVNRLLEIMTREAGHISDGGLKQEIDAVRLQSDEAWTELANFINQGSTFDVYGAAGARLVELSPLKQDADLLAQDFIGSADIAFFASRSEYERLVASLARTIRPASNGRFARFDRIRNFISQKFSNLSEPREIHRALREIRIDTNEKTLDQVHTQLIDFRNRLSVDSPQIGKLDALIQRLDLLKSNSVHGPSTSFDDVVKLNPSHLDFNFYPAPPSMNGSATP